MLAIVGDPGVGKSALLGWAEDGLDDVRILRATGTPPDREIPFSGLLELLRPTLPLLGTIPRPQAVALSSALALDEEKSGDRFAIGAATLSLLCRYAEDGPVAVLLDDVHLIDESSAGAIMFAARRLGSDAIAVLATARAGEAVGLLEGVDRVELAGLDPEAARALAAEVSATPITDEEMRRLQARTDGNPLAIVELAADPEALLPSGDIPVPVSAALVAAFGRRLGQLPGPTRSVLLVAAACNGDLRLTGLACTRLGLELGELSAAEESGLVRLGAAQISFRHPLVRAAIHSGAPPDRRRQVHQAVAAVLPPVDVDRRAWHLSEAQWAPDDAVASLLTTAGGRAESRSAYEVASALHERAARRTADTTMVPPRLLAAARCAWTAGHGGRASALLDELEQVGDGEVALQTVRLRAQIASRSGSVRQACTLLLSAAQSCDDGDQATLLLAEAVQAALFLADAVMAQDLVGALEQGVDRAATPGARAMGTLAIGMARAFAGHGGVEELRAAESLLRDSPELTAEVDVSWLMLAPLYIRDADGGRELRVRVESARDRAGVGALPWLLFLLARDEATSDSWVRAAADYAEAVALARVTGQTTELAMALAGLAWLEARTGRDVDAQTHAAEALELCRAREIHWGEAWVQLALGELALVRGDAATSFTVLEALDDLLAGLGVGDPDLSPRPELVAALVRLGRREEARSMAEDFRVAAQAKGQPWSRARAYRCLGLVGEDPDTSFDAALALHAQTRDVFETARTELAYGEVLRRAGRRIEARGHLRSALAGFTRLGAEPWADQAASELNLTGERVRHRAMGGVQSLTPQELQVALLLADGRTTKEAAAALFVSPKTVEYHLRKVYTKLGISSRAELSGEIESL